MNKKNEKPIQYTVPSLCLAAVVLASCAIRCGKDTSISPTVKAGQGSKVELPEKVVSQKLPVLASCFDGSKAMAQLEKLLAIGPRSPGTEGAEKTRDFIITTLQELGLKPVRHEFTAFTPHPRFKELLMANITVDFPGAGDKKILLGGHYDVKLLESGDFVGANDGGSSTALLLEMARCLAANPPPAPVRLAFFDGEEAMVRWTDSDSLYGSKRMAAELAKSGEAKSFAAMINMDMIGDNRLKLERDSLSTPWTLDILERESVSQGHHSLFQKSPTAISDDHVPFQRVGIPSALLIDLRYGPGWTSNDYWHTDRDTISKVSANSMSKVGKIVLASLARLAAGKSGND